MLSAPPAPTVLQRLRDATQPAHADLEMALPLMRADLTLATYCELLSRFVALYTPLEARLLQHAPALASLGIDMAARRKSPWLRLDLRALGADFVAERPQSPPLMPQVRNVWQAMGCLYVTEGATLGGQLIARHLRRRLGLDRAAGGRFFQSYGGETGAMWRGYQAALLRCGEAASRQGGEARVAQVVTSATELFVAFRAHLVPRLSP